jgi:hypothetical protein
MSIESGPPLLGLVAPAAEQSGTRMPLVGFLVLTLLLPSMTVIGNFVVGVLTPITLGSEDELALIDPVWRLVQGQYFGTDFHYPLGFGLFQIAAILWRLFGPHYYVLRGSVDIFALVIALCGCVVAVRQLRHAAGLAALFCMTLAFVASGPSIYGIAREFGMALSYNRLLMSGLLVLFVQSFANDSDVRRERGYIDYLIAAFLLNILFLIKISGLFVGLMILVIGSILRGPSWLNLIDTSVVLLFLAIMLAIDLIITGTSLSALIQDYRMAAQGRVGAVSARDILWFAVRLPVLGVVVLLALFAVSWPIREGTEISLVRCFCIIAFYWICQVVLNMSNTGCPPDLITLAPAAAVAVVTWTDTSAAASFWDRLWRRLNPRRLRWTPLVRQPEPLLKV